MTKEEISVKIQEFTTAAENLPEPDKTFKLGEINQLKIQLEGMALDELKQILDEIQLPDLANMDEKIKEANDATKGHQMRVNAFNAALGFLKTALKMAI